MITVDIEIAEAHFKELCLEAGADQSGVEETDFSVSITSGFKEAKEVLERIPHLLEMLSDGKISSIKITEL